MGRLAEKLNFVNFGNICKDCTENCCKRFYAVLLYEEEKDFSSVASEIKTEYGIVRTLGSPDGRNCPFLSEKGYCNIYEKRPFDCRLWPIMMYYDFENKEYILVLDRECPAAARGKIPDDMLKKMLNTAREIITKRNVDGDWIKKYTLCPWPKNYEILERIKEG